MSDVTKIKGGVLLECDCGLNHKITKDGEDLKLKTTYSKPVNKDEKNVNKPEKPEDEEDDEEDSIF